MEKRDKTAEEDDGFSSKKIHVRSKDPSKIARQFEKSEKSKNGVRNGSKVFLNPFHIFDPDLSAPPFTLTLSHQPPPPPKVTEYDKTTPLWPLSEA